MWNNFLAEIVKYLTPFDVKWNSPFTFAQQIFHSEAISLGEAKFHSPKANFVEKREQVFRLALFFLEVPPGIEPGIEVLQTFALPLGHGTIFRWLGYYSTGLFVCQAFLHKFIFYFCYCQGMRQMRVVCRFFSKKCKRPANFHRSLAFLL